MTAEETSPVLDMTAGAVHIAQHGRSSGCGCSPRRPAPGSTPREADARRTTTTTRRPADVTADDRAIEALRRPRAVSPDSRASGARPSDDPALGLLLDLPRRRQPRRARRTGRPPLPTASRRATPCACSAAAAPSRP